MNTSGSRDKSDISDCSIIILLSFLLCLTRKSFHVSDAACLTVCEQDYAKTNGPIYIKFGVNIQHGPRRTQCILHRKYVTNRIVDFVPTGSSQPSPRSAMHCGGPLSFESPS